MSETASTGSLPLQRLGARDYRDAVAKIRRTRLHPRRTDPLYLHLRRIRDDLRAVIGRLDVTDVLDVFCGARPYEPLFSQEVRYVGFDVDDAYGCADVVSEHFLPFPSESFDLCLCTQSFYFLPDAAAAIGELRRVLRPGGHLLLTQPIVYPGTERLYTGPQLRELLADGWDDLEIIESGGTIVSIATLLAYVLHQIEKRLPRRARAAFAGAYFAGNVAAEVGDVLERRFLSSADTLPANLLVHATRPRRSD